MKKIKLFIPHAEIRIFVTDEMIKDFNECLEDAKHFMETGKVREGKEEIKFCGNCSWKDCKLIHTTDLIEIPLCSIPGLEEKMTELIREGE